MAFIGVGMSPLVARWRKTVSAAMNPIGVMLMPLYLIVAGPGFSAFFASACSLATGVFRASFLALQALTVEVRGTTGGVTSAGGVAGSVGVVLASAAPEV